MENFDRENIDELLEIHQIRQYFPRQNFASFGSFEYYVIIILHTNTQDEYAVFVWSHWGSIFPYNTSCSSSFECSTSENTWQITAADLTPLTSSI